MLDVHPPHEPVHGIRDFLLHLLTITVGLLIALGLENAAEAWHHRHQRHKADEIIRQEIRDNGRDLATVHAAIASETENLHGILDFLQARSEGRTYDIHKLTLSYSQNTLSDASWSTAAATGILSYMGYEHVQSYARAYQLQAQFVALERESLQDFLELQSYVVYKFDPAKLTPADATAAMKDVRRAVAHLEATDQIGEQLRKDYEAALRDEE